MDTVNTVKAMGERRQYDWPWGATERTHTEWAQVSGDIGAATWGAVFAQVHTERYGDESRVSVQLVKVFNWEIDAGETLSDADENGPYYVETYDLDPWMMFEGASAQYHAHLEEIAPTLRDDISVGDLLTVLALHIAGYYGYNETYNGQYQTLGDAMRAQHIPQAALWRESEYNVRVQWGATCKYMSLEHVHPRANHLAALAEAYMGLVDIGEMLESADILKHMRQVATLMDTHGDTIPQWYVDNPQPCDAWRALETF